MSVLTFSLEGSSETSTRFSGKTRQFQLTIDEPPALGGEDAAANPVEYLLAGYAGCLNVVGHLVAKEQNIQLRKLSIRLEGDIDPSRFLGKPTHERAGFRQIKVVLDPETDASPEQLKNWLRTVESRCPVNDNLTRVTPVSIGLRIGSRANG